ncbi:hypothetical protein P4C99_11155 [Pontiellaceae bacterium B1224]|nr:hypothetical protein [Pontiellaceae bacterium B1224]
MKHALTDKELDHLLRFVGYGRLDSDIWFLGMEEGVKKGATVSENIQNIRARLKFRQVEDCRDAHEILDITMHHSGKKKIQSTWRGMCYIMLRLEDRAADRESIRNYQANSLGRAQGNTLLVELMPIPKSKIASWDYENFIPQFTSATDYYRTTKPRRIQYLRQLLSQHHPKVIIGYGKEFWNDYKALFPALNFSKERCFEVAYNEKMLVVLTDHFVARSMNGKFDDIVSIINARSIL